MKRRTEASGSRFYTHPETGVELPSVTTVQNVLPKHWLAPWAAKVERELCVSTAYAVYQSLGEYVTLAEFKKRFNLALPREKAHKTAAKAASDIGTEAHNVIDWRLRGELGLERDATQPEASEPALWSVASFEDWRKETQFKPLHSELGLYSDELKSAGTADTIACELNVYMNGAPKPRRIKALGDWKTSAAIRDDHPMQVATYRHMAIEREILDEASWGLVLRLPKVAGDTFEARFVPPSECRALVEVFKAARVIWEWSR